MFGKMIAMQSATSTDSSNPFEGAAMSADVATLLRDKDQRIANLERQLDWFRRQIFGQKSERFAPMPDPMQMYLGEVPALPAATSMPVKSIAAHTRRANTKDAADTGEALPFFDESRVPVQTIVLVHADVEGLSPDQYEIIGEKVTYRLAQRPGSYQVLKYRRPVIKLKDTQKILCLPAPDAVLQGSRADVSFIVGLLVDKFAWHLPLYRQHQRLAAAGITVSRPWLTQLSQDSIRLLEPIYDALFASIRASRVKAMDETPIKAGRTGHGKMSTGYFWPVYGELDEVCFPFCTSRTHAQVPKLLGLAPAANGVLLTDGYEAYRQYALKTGLTHAQCWAHSRREVFEAQADDPSGTAEALEQIKALYAVEEQIRKRKLVGDAKQLYRLTHAKPLVELFFEWVDLQLQRPKLTPSRAFTKALAYVRKRRLGLEVFLTDPDVPIDTNHLERALRAIPMGRKSWLFCSTELGAKHVGIIQSLITTCKLHDVDPYTYLVDVLQRVAEHPASKVAELTPRLWKTLFAQNPLRSDLHDFPR